jgi:hypothetical protein
MRQALKSPVQRLSGHTVRIGSAIGEVKLDLHKVTKGLAHAPNAVRAQLGPDAKSSAAPAESGFTSGSLNASAISQGGGGSATGQGNAGNGAGATVSSGNASATVSNGNGSATSTAVAQGSNKSSGKDDGNGPGKGPENGPNGPGNGKGNNGNSNNGNGSGKGKNKS